jgi:adenosine deaminase
MWGALTAVCRGLPQGSRTVRACESSGPKGVWASVELLGSDHIDHGVRAIEDLALVQMLADRSSPLDVCPTSNLALGVYPSIEAHPIERFRQAGVRVSVNIDARRCSWRELGGEYVLCRQAFGWTDEVTWEVTRTSIEASFANGDVKAEWLGKLRLW